MGIEENRKNLEKYIEDDEIYQSYLNKTETQFSDFDMFCINHCIDIKNILAKNEELRQAIEVNKRLHEKKCNELLNSIPVKKIQKELDKLNNNEYESKEYNFYGAIVLHDLLENNKK